MGRLVLMMTPLLALAATGSWAAEQPLANIAGPDSGTRIVADTEFAPEYSGAKVADGSLEAGSGCWYSRDQSPLPLALTFEFVQEADLRRVALVQAVWSGNMYHTREFAIEVSADGHDWQRVATGELPDESGARREVDLPPTRARWLRIVVLSSYNDFQTCGLAEVEIMAAGMPLIAPAGLTLNGTLATGLSLSHCGLSLARPADGPQVAVVERPAELAMALQGDEWIGLSFDVGGLAAPVTFVAQVRVDGGPATVWTGVRGGDRKSRQLPPGRHEIRFDVGAIPQTSTLWFSAHAEGPETLVWWRGLRLEGAGLGLDIPLRLGLPRDTSLPSPELPPLRPAMERVLIEWDWRLQDGLGTPRRPSTLVEAVARVVSQGEALLADLRADGVALDNEQREWRRLRASADAAPETEREEVWRALHWLKRRLALRNPLADTGPLVFAKQVPGAFSHQLTQYYGRYARPGGGIFVLEEPGQSFRTRSLTAGKLPVGSFQHPEVTFDADRVLFSYCQAETPPTDTIKGHPGRFFHLYTIRPDGSGLRQMTTGPFDDFSPRELPDGRVLMVSTRRGGWHRCGNPGCENYTLTVAEADGSGAQPISYHETQEWDPSLLHDGRIIYTRWDYVDRNAVFFEQLWTTAPDGSRPAIYYGNNTFNPVGIWEPRAVPGSRRVMATAAAHHAMTAGSIILVDVAAGVDGKDPIIRLTPDVVFPEGECLVPPGWFSAAREPRTTPEQERWPGHCYRSPFPLSEDYFLAAYSFDSLVGEPKANQPNMFGLYLVDRFGNKELLYRDLNIASVWPVPLRPRPRPPLLPLLPRETPRPAEGTFVVQNVYVSDPPLPAGVVRALRVLQVLPKSTPGIDNPPVGLPLGAPGKQVLGTVPVEADGSAHFRAPAGVPLAFQALDERGQAVQVMRSLTYLQPGEITSCVGCHEPRVAAPLAQRPLAARRSASAIRPAPEGAKPFSYPRLVQPVLDRHCVRCHGADNPAGGIRLTGEPAGHYTYSYNALAPRVPYSDQSSMDSLSRPDQYGARGSGLMKMLLAGHHGVQLDAGDIERLVTWMDANVLFYGTFDPEDQARQQRAEIIAGPKLE